MPSESSSPDAVLLADKPAGVTSHDVVAGVRRERGVRRVGHAGTLDPFATGLLLVLIGRATRLQRFLLALPKSYDVEARFGAVSTTGDPEGEIVETGVVPEDDLALPTGRIRQRPPIYSAIKVGGVRAYARARRGEDVDVPEREVDVHAFAELWRAGERRAFRITCSSGTYVRSLVADLGDAYCTALRRTAIGPFDVADAGRELTLEEALGFLPARELDSEEARGVGHGRAVIRAGEPEGPVRLVHEGAVLAVAEPRDELLRPLVVLRPDSSGSAAGR